MFYYWFWWQYSCGIKTIETIDWKKYHDFVMQNLYVNMQKMRKFD